MSARGELRVQDLSVRFAGQEHFLFSVASLEIAAGSSLGISGISGAGKTTLFHCLAGIAKPNTGAICWDGTDICSLRDDALGRWRHQNLGLVFQDFHLIDGLSALDNVLLPACFDSWRPAPAVRERACELLDAVGVATGERMAAMLSRGERQRVALARALLLQPGIVMTDEPTASLDPEHRRQIGDLLIELVRSQGATLIVISHEHELLARLDRRMSLRDGQLQLGTDQV
ncbi:MAG: ATP-binding cassette domain-containing protein [Comamonadaceae bacterium]|nr:MAG: ATP-binding cassette domain-containing protein [Comamonadaceae bacterium]